MLFAAILIPVLLFFALEKLLADNCGQIHVGPIRIRHYNHEYYYAHQIGLWYVCIFWHEIALTWED